MPGTLAEFLDEDRAQKLLQDDASDAAKDRDVTEAAVRRDNAVALEKQRLADKSSMWGVESPADRSTRALKNRVVGAEGPPASGDQPDTVPHLLANTIRSVFRGASFGGWDRLAALDRELTHKGKSVLGLVGNKDDPDYGAIPDTSYDEELNEQRFARANQDPTHKMLEGIGAFAAGSQLPFSKVAGPTASTGAKLLSRVARVGEGAGYGAGISKMEGQDPARGALLGAGGSALGEGIDAGLSKLSDNLANRFATTNLEPTASDVETFARRWGKPYLAGKAARELATPEGERVLPLLASHETRADRLKAFKDIVGQRQSEIFDSATKAGATIDPEEIIREAEPLISQTVGSKPVRATRGQGPTDRVRQELENFRQTYHRPAEVATDANGEPLISQSVRGSDVDRSAWPGRLEGAGTEPNGTYMPAGKAASMRVDSQAPSGAFDPTKDSTTRPAPYSGWKPVVKAGEPMTVQEANEFKSFLQNEVDRIGSGDPSVRDDADLAFKHKLSQLVRRKIEDSVGQTLGEKGLADIREVNGLYGTAEGLSGPVNNKFNNSYVGGPHQATPWRLLHKVPGLRYLPQVGQGIAENVPKLLSNTARAGGLAAASTQPSESTEQAAQVEMDRQKQAADEAKALELLK